jgi:uncharacterized protein
MQIHPNIQIRDLGLFLMKEKALIVGDLHIGYEAAMHKKGVLVPQFHFADLKKRLLVMMKGAKTVVINGDLKHEFGGINRGEWLNTKKLLQLFEGKRLIFVQGNHDRIIRPIIKDMELVDDIRFGDVLITHGDELKKTDAKVVIIGHEHPAVGLKEGSRVERFKCFLKGTWKGKILLAMPSCNLLTQGTDVLRESRLSPYLQHSLKNFDVYIVADTVYAFGKVKDLA